MIELKIQLLRYCIAVADSGSFHSAARQMKRTQPALSTAVRDFEQRLGHPIFEKGSKAKLTSFGQHILPKFRTLLSQHDTLAEQIAHFAAGQQGGFSLAAIPSVATRLLPIWLSEFVARFPDLKMHALDATSDLICKMVADDEVELGIGSLPEADERLHYLPLSHDRLGVVCHREHPLAQHTELRWQALMGHSLIRNNTMEALKKTKANSLLNESSITINNIFSLLNMLRHQHSVTLLPELAFPQGDTELVFIPLTEPYIERSVGLITRAGRVLSPAAAQFIQHVLNSMALSPPFPEPTPS